MKFEDFVKVLDAFDKAGYSVVSVAKENISDCYVVSVRIPVETMTKESIVVNQNNQVVGIQVKKSA